MDSTLADETPTPVPASETVAPSQGPATATPQAPAVETAAVEPAALSPEAPATVETPATETPAAEPAPEGETKTEDSSLLGDLAKEPEAKPEAEAERPAEEAKAPEAEAPVEEFPLPTYEKFTLPEGIELEEAKLGEFTKILGEFENSTRTDHTKMQLLGQKMVDMYTSEAKELVTRVQQSQVDVYQRTREGWKEDFRNDPEIGGKRQETTLKSCKAVLERYKASAGDSRHAALVKTFGLTGAGDNPSLIHFMNWAAQFAVERAKPVPATVPKAPNTTSRSAKRYGNGG